MIMEKRGRPKGIYLPFEEARQFVRTLGLTSTVDWMKWSASGERPSNIPSNPSVIYRDHGWDSLPDFLGCVSGRGKKKTRPASPLITDPFARAKMVIQTMGVKNREGFRALKREGNLPQGVPANPETAFKEQWQGWNDFLGTEPNPVGKKKDDTFAFTA
jgi:hypothetical protein